MQIQITVEVEDDEYLDKKHVMGITNPTYDRILDSLRWLGGVQDVEKV